MELAQIRDLRFEKKKNQHEWIVLKINAWLKPDNYIT